MTLSTDIQEINPKTLVKTDQLSAIASLGQLALSELALVDLMAQAAGLLLQALPVEYALIWELLDDKKHLLYMVGAGLEAGSVSRLQVPLEPNSLEAVTLGSKEPVLVENARQEFRFKISRLLMKLDAQSGISVLIGTPEKPYGVIQVFSRQVKPFRASDIAFLQSAANLIGLVLRQGRCEENLVTQNQKLMKELVRAQIMTSSSHFEWDRHEIKNRLIESRERERLRLAQDLHDAPIQDLYGMIYQLDDLREAVVQDPEGQKTLNECDQTLHRVINSLRSICRDLRPPSLSPFGLEVAIRDHAEKLHDQNPEIEIHLELMHDDQSLSDSLRLSLFRVYQQAMHNVMRHAQASEVYVRFGWDDETIILEVEDNGIGFEMPQNWMDLVHEEHFGLLGIAERVESIRGKLEIVSATGEGTLVRAVVPYQ